MDKSIKSILVTTAAVVHVSAIPFFGNPSVQGYKPPLGFVPDEATAIKVAEAILFPIYGREVIDKRPYKAKLVDGGKVWLVVGTVPALPDSNYFYVGGIPEIKISKADGRVIYVGHGK